MSISLSSPSGSGEEVITSPTDLTSLSLQSSDEEMKDLNNSLLLSQTINDNKEVLLPLMAMNDKNDKNESKDNKPNNQRPNSILKTNAHKRSCSTGIQLLI